MRPSNRQVITQSLVSVTKTATDEQIVSISENKDLGVIVAEVKLYDGDEVIGNEFYEMSGEKYEMLMSDSPSFAPGKPQNEYREIDLWYVIDLIRYN